MGCTSQPLARKTRMTIRVFLIDDHALVRTGMKMILSK
ncbi:two-component system response regulator UvrY, partial [Xanthomonas citri pv. glycines]